MLEQETELKKRIVDLEEFIQSPASLIQVTGNSGQVITAGNKTTVVCVYFACTNFPGINIQGKNFSRSRMIAKIKRTKIKRTKILLRRRARDLMELEEFRVDVMK